MNGKGENTVNLNAAVSELTSILEREIRSFTTLFELLMIEEKGLVECDSALILDVLGRQEDVLSSIACLEKSRQEVVSRIGIALDLDTEALTISQIAEYIEPPEKRKLNETVHVLREIEENLQHKKITNTLLIRQGALLVENSLRYLVKKYGKGNLDSGTYHADARSGAVTGSIGVDGRM